MKRITLLLTIAATVLGMTGCGGNKTAPSLSSDSPRERVQAVRQAQEKWGAHQREKTANQEAIVGRWNHPQTDRTYIVFTADGKFKRASVLFSTKGTYRLLSNDIIEMNYEGILGRWEWNYRLIGDSLEIKDGNFVTFTRAPE